MDLSYAAGQRPPACAPARGCLISGHLDRAHARELGVAIGGSLAVPTCGPGRNVVSRGSVGVLVLTVTVALLAAGFRSSPPAVGPGGKIGAMTLVRGNEHEADDELWGRYCAPSTPEPGRYSRTCSVP